MTYIFLFFLPFLKTNQGDNQVHGAGPLPLPFIPQTPRNVKESITIHRPV